MVLRRSTRATSARPPHTLSPTRESSHEPPYERDDSSEHAVSLGGDSENEDNAANDADADGGDDSDSQPPENSADRRPLPMVHVAPQKIAPPPRLSVSAPNLNSGSFLRPQRISTGPIPPPSNDSSAPKATHAQTPINSSAPPRSIPHSGPTRESFASSSILLHALPSFSAADVLSAHSFIKSVINTTDNLQPTNGNSSAFAPPVVINSPVQPPAASTIPTHSIKPPRTTLPTQRRTRSSKDAPSAAVPSPSTIAAVESAIRDAVPLAARISAPHAPRTMHTLPPRPLDNVISSRRHPPSHSHRRSNHSLAPSALASPASFTPQGNPSRNTNHLQNPPSRSHDRARSSSTATSHSIPSHSGGERMLYESELEDILRRYGRQLLQEAGLHRSLPDTPAPFTPAPSAPPVSATHPQRLPEHFPTTAFRCHPSSHPLPSLQIPDVPARESPHALHTSCSFSPFAAASAPLPHMRAYAPAPLGDARFGPAHSCSCPHAPDPRDAPHLPSPAAPLPPLCSSYTHRPAPTFGTHNPRDGAYALDPNEIVIPDTVIAILRNGWWDYIPLDSLTNDACHSAAFGSLKPEDSTLGINDRGHITQRSMLIDSRKEKYMDCSTWKQSADNFLSALRDHLIMYDSHGNPDRSLTTYTIQSYKTHFRYLKARGDVDTNFSSYLLYCIFVRRQWLAHRRTGKPNVPLHIFQVEVFADIERKRVNRRVDSLSAAAAGSSSKSFRTSDGDNSSSSRSSADRSSAKKGEATSGKSKAVPYSSDRVKTVFLCMYCGSPDHRFKACEGPGKFLAKGPDGKWRDSAGHLYCWGFNGPAGCPRAKLHFPITTPLRHERWTALLLETGGLAKFAEVPKGLQFGFSIGIEDFILDHTFSPQNHYKSPSHHQFVVSKYAEEIRLGRVSPGYPPSLFFDLFGHYRTAPLNVIERTPGKLRITVDHSFPRDNPLIPSVNSCIDSKRFQCAWGTFAECYLLVADAPPGSEAAVFDVESAFRNIPTRPIDRTATALLIDGLVHLDGRLNFGKSSAPGVFGLVADAIVWIFLHKGIQALLKWVDDFVFFRYPRALADDSHPSFTYDESLIWSLAEDLGWPWAPDKFAPFSSSFTYIGFNWSLAEKTVSLPDKKRTKYLLKLSDWCLGSLVSLQATESLIGMLNHVTLVVPQGRSHLPALYKFRAAFPSSRSFIKHRITPAVRTEIEWWTSTLASSSCTLPIVRPPPPMDTPIFVDASTSWGIGFVMNGRWLAWQLLPGWKCDGRDIGWAEMVAVDLAVRAITVSGARNSHLVIRSDNSGVVGSLAAGRSRNSQQNLILRHLVSNFQDANLWITTQWVSTSDNIADSPSRGVFPSRSLLFPCPPALPPYLKPFIAPSVPFHCLPPQLSSSSSLRDTPLVGPGPIAADARRISKLTEWAARVFRRRYTSRRSRPPAPSWDADGGHSARVGATITRAWRATTSAKYSSAVDDFTAYCSRNGIPLSECLPASERLLCTYASSFAGSLAGRSIRNKCSALRSWHIANGLPWLGATQLSYVIKGAENMRPPESLRPIRPAVTTDMLRTLEDALDDSNPFDACVLFVATTAFWAQLRLGELLPTSEKGFDASGLPSWSSLQPPNRAGSQVLHLPRTKTSGSSGDTTALETHLRILLGAVTNVSVPEQPDVHAIRTFEQRFTIASEVDRLLKGNHTSFQSVDQLALNAIRELRIKCATDPTSLIVLAIGRVPENALRMMFGTIHSFGLSSWCPDLIGGTPTSSYNGALESIAIWTFEQSASIFAYQHLSPNLCYLKDTIMIQKLYRNFLWSYMKDLVLKEQKEPGSLVRAKQENKAYNILTNRRHKYLHDNGWNDRVRLLAVDPECTSDQEDNPTGPGFLIMNKPARNIHITHFLHTIDSRRQTGTPLFRGQKRNTRREEPRIPHPEGRTSRISERLPQNCPLDWFSPAYFNSMDITFRALYIKAPIALPLKDAFQRLYLELQAALDWHDIYEPRISGQIEVDAGTPVARVMGVFTSNLGVCEELFRAKIPVFLIRGGPEIRALCINELVTARRAEGFIPLSPAIDPSHPTIYRRSAMQLAKYTAMRRFTRYFHTIGDPFNSHRMEQPVVPPPNVPMTDRKARTQRYSPSQEKQGHIEPQGRSKFEDLPDPILPPVIPVWRDALRSVDQSPSNFVNQDVLGSDFGYAFPEPASFIAYQNRDRRASTLRCWLRYRVAFIHRLSVNGLTARPMSGKAWRDLLGLDWLEHSSSGSDRKKADRQTKSATRLELLSDFLQNCLGAEDISNSEVAHGSETWQGKPFGDLQDQDFEEILWEMAELNFRQELLALQIYIRRGDADFDLYQEQQRVANCFPGGQLLVTPLSEANTGIASYDEEERCRYLLELQRLMRPWPGKKPDIFHVDSWRWSTGDVQALEAAIAKFYTQTFFNHFRRAPIIPRRLSHDVPGFEPPPPLLEHLNPAPNMCYDMTQIVPFDQLML
ncbi:hypothetical protein D9615_009520 [Tricholomella constricta]|uniref:Uncharacterized protein n=1 Tax=Tricholomella constricta TaxID=117010 RepID=A0A8H5LWG2_9AGAR|nr:hypothetical protein D9615_009520 [Tricholomella constricta]